MLDICPKLSEKDGAYISVLGFILGQNCSPPTRSFPDRRFFWPAQRQCKRSRMPERAGKWAPTASRVLSCQKWQGTYSAV